MGNVHMRFFQVAISPNGDGIPEVAGIATPDEVDLTVNLAKAVIVNALATPASGPARYATLRHEARLLACLLVGTSSTSSVLHLDSAFEWSARHIRSFVAEGAGLGLLTAAAEEFFGWRANPRLLHHFDALPTRLLPRFGSRGIRPDLLFNFGGSEGIAGEAKGRSRKAPTKVLAEQIKFMDKLLYWSHAHDDHPVVLSCAFLTSQVVTVDLFSLGSHSRSLLQSLVRERGGRGGAEWVVRDTTPDPRYDEAIAQARQEQAAQNRRRRVRDLADEEGDVLGYLNGIDRWDSAAPADLRAEATRRAAEIEENLYRDASALVASDLTRRQTLLRRSVVGSWTPLDLFNETGPSRHLFFGLLDEHLTAGEVADLWADRRNRPSDEAEIDVDVTSRMIVAITKRPSSSPPSWENVQAAVERR